MGFFCGINSGVFDFGFNRKENCKMSQWEFARGEGIREAVILTGPNFTGIIHVVDMSKYKKAIEALKESQKTGYSSYTEKVLAELEKDE